VIRHAALALSILSILWLAAVLTAPFGATLPYIIGNAICHQRPERSFWIAGAPMPVCARCTGLYASAALGSVLALAAAHASVRTSTLGASRRVRLALAVAAVPTAITLVVEWLDLASPSPVVRAAAAVPIGAAAGWIVTTAVKHAEVD
jgi:uncharacterized membrane protein